MNAIDNPSPIVHDAPARKSCSNNSSELDSTDIYDLICHIKDPEHPYTLEQLRVIKEEDIEVSFDETSKKNAIMIQITPTVPHCNLATTIGLCLKEKLKRDLPDRSFKLTIRLTPGSHNTEKEVTKQINDKERVSAAMENPYLSELVDRCLQEDG
eukprot:TRINITY_DN10533_c0_g1_i1.p1 TRINITY_DN10533_c0_g1~~TRINITY_DN10533_c0_g1_i1.p1  ORF type:complete len:155 (-),score=41.14 TRINITY_DN10533_c0_g1_i1:201-665(-)